MSKQTIDNSDEGYILKDKYISTYMKDVISLKGVGPPLWNAEALVNYYNELVILDESKIRPIDSIFWNKFKRLDIINLKMLKGKNYHCSWI